MLSLVDICKSHGRGKRRLQILSEVSLSVAGGEIVGILGSRHEDGATLLEVAAGLVQPDTGQIRLDEIDVTRLSKRGANGSGAGTSYGWTVSCHLQQWRRGPATMLVSAF